VLLKRWIPYFDITTERMDILLIWVRLPRLPPEFCSYKCFKSVNDAMGSFLEADMSFKESGEMTMVRILVSLNVHEGLAEEM
jgi:hypothetical protein